MKRLLASVLLLSLALGACDIITGSDPEAELLPQNPIFYSNNIRVLGETPNDFNQSIIYWKASKNGIDPVVVFVINTKGLYESKNIKQTEIDSLTGEIHYPSHIYGGTPTEPVVVRGTLSATWGAFKKDIVLFEFTIQPTEKPVLINLSDLIKS